VVQLNRKSVVVLALVVLLLVAGAFWLGMRQSSKVSSAAPPNTSTLPAGHPEAAANARFSHFRVGNRNVKAMYADGDQVWIGTSGGVIRYNIGSEDYKLYNVESRSLLSNGVFHLNKLDEQLLVGTYGGGLSIFDIAHNAWKNINIPDGLADQFVYDSKRAPNGDVWIATWSGVNRVAGARFADPKAWTTYNVANTRGGLPNDWVYALDIAADGSLWFATEGGLARLQNGVWTHWQHEQGLGADYEAVKDDIRFNADPAQVSRHHAQQKADQGLGNVKVAFNPNYVVALKVDAQGVVWCGTWGGGLARFDGEQFRNYTTKDGLPSNHVFSLFIGKNQRLWIGTSHGLAHFRAGGNGFEVLRTADGLFADNVFSMSTAQDGSLWVGSFGGVAKLTGL